MGVSTEYFEMCDGVLWDGRARSSWDGVSASYYEWNDGGVPGMGFLRIAELGWGEHGVLG